MTDIPTVIIHPKGMTIEEIEAYRAAFPNATVILLTSLRDDAISVVSGWAIGLAAIIWTYVGWNIA